MNSEIIDLHVHFGAPKDEKSGCYWSKKFTEQPAYYAMLLLTKSLFKRITIKTVKKHLLKTINRSKLVDKVVMLAMDQVYDKSGTVHPESTHLHVPNNYVAQLAKENKRILFGASVHPYRSDWSEELDYCLENRAVLCKWIPSSQMIDLTHEKCLNFYKKLARHKLPLLCHAGPEYAIPTSSESYNKFNNPKYLRNALDEGVTVIVAHCAMPYWGLLDYDYQDDFEEFLRLFEEAERKGWNLYADLSAICTPFRIGYVREIKEKTKNISHGRLLFGSDYPIPLSELCFTKRRWPYPWIKYVLQVLTMKNPLDKNYQLIKEMGFDEAIFTHANTLFSSIQYSVV